ncbi:MAG: excinuclease ABC subunit UvrC [Alphaproteobacteria bacterium]
MNNIKTAIDVIKDVVKSVSKKPGVYRMLDKNDKLLYVGKAKNLKNRITNYTQFDKQPIRIQRMISRTHRMEIVETNSESEALLLESDLIKSLKPYYNVLLRDDKSYPEIELSVDDDGNTSIKKHRGVHKKGNRYFGPFTSAKSVNETIGVLDNLFKLNDKSTDTDTNKSSYKQRYLPVLQHQFLRSFAPDGGNLTDDLDMYITEVVKFLSGKDNDLLNRLNKKMMQASDNENYELAKVYKDRINSLNNLKISQGANMGGIGNADVFAIAKSGNIFCIQVMFYRDSKASGSALFFPKTECENEAEVLGEFIPQFYADNKPVKKVYISTDITDKELLNTTFDIKINIPKMGMGKTIITTAYDNAVSALSRHKSSILNHTQGMEELANALGFDELLSRIEVYDNSHLQGTNPVGAMIVVNEMGFDKKSYRHWNIKTDMTRRDNRGKAGDDYAMMREVFTRRFSRAIKEKSVLPDLVVVDGGKGQLKIANEVLDELKLNVNVVSIAKGEKRNDGSEVFYTKNGTADIPISSLLHYFMERIRDEAHRFVITLHRKKRSKQIAKSPLDEIAGIGKTKRNALLRHFGSSNSISGLSIDDLMQVEGISKKTAETIFNHFHK